MSIVKPTGNKFRIASADTFVLASPGGTDEGTWAVTLVSNSFSGSVTVKARTYGPESTGDNIAFTAWFYRTNAGAIATAALTAAAVFLVPAGGMEIALDCTTFTSGSLDVYVKPVAGIVF